MSSLRIFRDQPRLHTLLSTYRDALKPPAGVKETPWQDRVMVMEETPPDELSRMHGRAMALGWLETRVDPDVFAVAGRLERCYRLTPEGVAALRAFELYEDIDEDAVEPG